jgi:hypothetical protein
MRQILKLLEVDAGGSPQRAVHDAFDIVGRRINRR